MEKSQEVTIMPLKPAPIVISDTVYQIVSTFARSRTLPARQVERAKIFMLCADGLNNLQISEQVSIGQDSVSKWRTRFLNSLSRLQEVEEQNPTKLESEVTALLSDYARPGQPPTYTDEQIIRILEIACRNPEEYGYETSHWSLNQLVDVTIKEGIANFISAKTISRFLKYGEDPPASRPVLAAFLRKSGKSGNIYGKSQ